MQKKQISIGDFGIDADKYGGNPIFLYVVEATLAVSNVDLMLYIKFNGHLRGFAKC